MKIQVNLATRPFVELRPLFARLRITMAVLAVLALGLGFGLHSLSVKAHDEEQKVNAVEGRTDSLRREKSSAEARMRQPQNAAVLERAHFLNDLFARKSFSWTAVMMDLEDVLPAGVQVTSIEPSVTTNGDVNIRLKVAGDRDRAVQLVRNLETSKRFLSPRLSDESMQAQEHAGNGNNNMAMANGGVEFDILAGYNPLPGKREKKLEQDRANTEAAEKKPSVAAKAPAVKTVKPVAPKTTTPKPVTPKATATNTSKPTTAPKPAGGKR